MTVGGYGLDFLVPFLSRKKEPTGGIFAVVDEILPGNSIDPFNNLFLTQRTRRIK
jgi:hypothetical protein